MKDGEIIERLPLHLDYVPNYQLKRLLKTRHVLAVVTEGEIGVNLRPGPLYVPPHEIGVPQ